MDKKNVIIVILAALLAAVVSGGAVYYWQQNQDESSSSTTQSTESEDKTSEETTETQQTTASNENEEALLSDEEVFSQLLAAKHSQSVDKVELTVNENTGYHASGVVKFTGEISGAWWLAAKVNDGWVLVADGNGTVMCDDIDSYNFPTDMVPECWDEATQTLITR